ncbi:hypothetical protein LXL04_019302 [Taraxacum kok-saghyz]
MKEAAERKAASSPLKNDSVGGSAITFFFTNFPEDSTEAGLWKTFREAGDIVDLFIARKRSLAGKKFGFARFRKVRDNAAMEGKLNNLYVGGAQIKANVARFSRGTKPSPPHQHQPVKVKSKIVKLNTGEEHQATPVGTSRSYADMLNGKIPVREDTWKEATEEEQVVNIITPQCSRDKLQKSLIGEARNYDKLKHIQALVTAEGISDVKIYYIGGFNVQLEFASQNVAQNFKDNAKAVWKKWFSSLHDWDPKFCCNTRLASITIVGLPPHAWMQNTFSEIASLWGEILLPELCMEGKEIRDRGKVAIITSQMIKISETVVVMVDDVHFRVLVEEDVRDSECLAPLFFLNDDSPTEESEDDNDWQETSWEVRIMTHWIANRHPLRGDSSKSIDYGHAPTEEVEETLPNCGAWEKEMIKGDTCDQQLKNERGNSYNPTLDPEESAQTPVPRPTVNLTHPEQLRPINTPAQNDFQLDPPNPDGDGAEDSQDENDLNLTGDSINDYE